MYIPKDAVVSTAPHEIIALIGEPGSGKTTSALTFPNPIFGNIENKLPPGVTQIPMWSADWCENVMKIPRRYKVGANSRPNKRDAIKKWLAENFQHFAPEQTFILDNWTFLQLAFDEETNLEDDNLPVNPKTGNRDGFWFWKQKLRWSSEVIGYLKSMPCRVVVTFHETRERDDDGNLTSKIRPCQDGSFKDQLLGHFTDVWRQLKDPVVTERDDKGNMKSKKIMPGFWWQLIGDEVVNCNTNPGLGQKLRAKGIKYVPADYSEIVKIYNTSI